MKLRLSGAFVLFVALAGCARPAARPPATAVPRGQLSTFGATAELRASALPVGKMSTRPVQRPPGDIRYSEQLPPFSFVSAYEAMHVSSVKSPDIPRKHVFNDTDEPVRFCITSAEEPSDSSFPSDEWSGAAATWAQASSTEAMHAERLDDRADPALTILDVWADGNARGIRPILRRTIPLRPLAEVAGVKLFAFRDVRDDGKSFVQVVVSRPPVRRGSVLGAPFVIGLANGDTIESHCSHVRVALPLVAGDARMASVDVAVEVAAEPIPLPGGEVSPSRARHMRVNLSSTWLARDRDATIDARLVWIGSEQSRLEMRGVPGRPPVVMRNARGDME